MYEQVQGEYGINLIWKDKPRPDPPPPGADRIAHSEILKKMAWSNDDYDEARKFGRVPLKAKYGLVYTSGRAGFTSRQEEVHSRRELDECERAFRDYVKRNR
jgi:hypothetical protein